jgi:hypothetical protein
MKSILLTTILIFSMGCSQSKSEPVDIAIARMYKAEVNGSMSQLEDQTPVYEINVKTVL